MFHLIDLGAMAEIAVFETRAACDLAALGFRLALEIDGAAVVDIVCRFY